MTDRFGPELADERTWHDPRTAGLLTPVAARILAGRSTPSDEERRAPAQVRLRSFFEDLFANPAFQPLDLTPEQVSLADEARPNNDPFDGLTCPAARRLGLPLITRDTDIADWGRVRVVW